MQSHLASWLKKRAKASPSCPPPVLAEESGHGRKFEAAQANACTEAARGQAHHEQVAGADLLSDEGLLEEPEDEMCEPAWSEPLELTGVGEEGQASSSSSTPASEIDPATLVPPTSVGQMSRFFSLRLANGTASKKNLGKHLRWVCYR